MPLSAGGAIGHLQQLSPFPAPPNFLVSHRMLFPTRKVLRTSTILAENLLLFLTPQVAFLSDFGQSPSTEHINSQTPRQEKRRAINLSCGLFGQHLPKATHNPPRNFPQEAVGIAGRLRVVPAFIIRCSQALHLLWLSVTVCVSCNVIHNVVVQLQPSG